MKLISHRGNIDGPNLNYENNPLYIIDALTSGYDVEVDVWFVDDDFFLGHDKPTYKIEESFLEKDGLWCHSKNIESLEKMLLNKNIHCFWHQEDRFTLTSKNFIWTFPNNILTKNSICVLPEKSNHSYDEIKICHGVCSDFIKNYA
jgi:hypothetical protein